jgi:hypothetical protein
MSAVTPVALELELATDTIELAAVELGVDGFEAPPLLPHAAKSELRVKRLTY